MTIYAQFLARALATPPPADCWSWNRDHGRLSARDSSIPGPWRHDLVSHLRHWHNLASARRGVAVPGVDQYARLVEQIWLIAGTQSMKTRSVLYAMLGYLVDQHPAPKGLILPRLKDFKRVLKNRVRPFFEETPRLARHLPRSVSKTKSDVTLEQWYLDTCTIYMLCGELADDLRSFPICDVLFDEFDLLPLNVEEQGDPIDLALDRQKTFPGRKLAVGVTTPTTVDGHGWRRLCSGSHERLLIRCPECGADQELHWSRLRAPDDATAEQVKVRRLATWECAYCPHEIADDWTEAGRSTKDRLVAEAAARGSWVPGRWKIDAHNPTGIWTPAAIFDERHQLVSVPPPETPVRSGHLSTLYSPFTSLSEFKAHELAAFSRGNDDQQTAHINGWRCEPIIRQLIAPPTIEVLAEVTGRYGYTRGTAPEGPLHLALIADQQGNSRDTAWFPWEVRGYRPGESWLIDCGQVKGYDALRQLGQRKWVVGRQALPIAVEALDGNNGTMRVPNQEWAAADPKRRFLLHGRRWPDFLWRERVAGEKREKRNQRMVSGARAYLFHANAYKTELDGMMRGKEGSKLWNLPDDCPDFYRASLTAEEQQEREERIPGQGKRKVLVWEPRSVHDETGKIIIRTDNHWWDTAVMGLVVADILGWNDEKPKPEPMDLGDWFKKGPR